MKNGRPVSKSLLSKKSLKKFFDLAFEQIEMAPYRGCPPLMTLQFAEGERESVELLRLPVDHENGPEILGLVMQIEHKRKSQVSQALVIGGTGEGTSKEAVILVGRNRSGTESVMAIQEFTRDEDGNAVLGEQRFIDVTKKENRVNTGILSHLFPDAPETRYGNVS